MQVDDILVRLNLDVRFSVVAEGLDHFRLISQGAVERDIFLRFMFTEPVPGKVQVELGDEEGYGEDGSDRK